MKKKIIALLMVVIMICCALPTVFATDEETPVINPRWNHIFYISAQLTEYGYAEGEASLYEANRVNVYIELQEKNGNHWEVTGDSNSGSDIGHCLVQDDYTLEDGVDYRLRVTVSVYDDSDKLIESATKYSSVVTG